MPRRMRREHLDSLHQAAVQLELARTESARQGDLTDEAEAASLILAGAAGNVMAQRGRSCRDVMAEIAVSAVQVADSFSLLTLADVQVDGVEL